MAAPGCMLHSIFICRLVNKVLEEELKVIHAFQMKTLTPEQWEKTKAS